LKFVVFVQNQTELWFSFTPAYTFGFFVGNLKVFWKSGVFCQKTKKTYFWTLPVLKRFGAKFCFVWRNLEICSFRAKSNRTLIFLYPCLYFWSIFRKSGGFLKIWSFLPKKQTKTQFLDPSCTWAFWRETLFFFDENLWFVFFAQNQTEPWFSLTPAYTFWICLGNL